MFLSLPDSSVDILEVRLPRKFLQVTCRASMLVCSQLIFLEILAPGPFLSLIIHIGIYKRQNINNLQWRVSLGATQLIVARFFRTRRQSHLAGSQLTQGLSWDASFLVHVEILWLYPSSS